MPDLATVQPDGRLVRRFHPGQARAWRSKKRIVLVLAGSQGGKTAWGPHWLHREIMTRGPGDYLVVSPSFQLMLKKMLPEFMRLFKGQLGLGDYSGATRIFTFSPDGQRRTHGTTSDTTTQVFFGHAADPESLESATAKAAWLDEAGQKRFRLGSWEAIQRRLAVHQGRVLLTTTPYDLGWLYTVLFQPWKREKDAGQDHPDIDVINFPSIANPAFPREEFERARRSLPGWKFRMFFMGMPERPAGLIYDVFDRVKHVVPPFVPEPIWPRWGGMDFGAVNTAAVLIAEEWSPQHQPTGRLVVYREYHPGKRDIAVHVKAINAGEPRMPMMVGGSASEDDWRERFARAGLPVREPPVRDVEVGIDVVYGAIARGELFVTSDCVELLDELDSYSRELDDAGEPTEKIEAANEYHLLDALRYILVYLKRGGQAWTTPSRGAPGEMATAPDGTWSAEQPRTEGGGIDWDKVSW